MNTVRTCLIVEDEFLTAESLRIQLESLGHRVLGHARNGSEAVDKALQLRPDIIFMDVRLGPGIDGVFASLSIEKELRTRVIYITGSLGIGTLTNIYGDKPSNILVKPFSYEQLRASIENVSNSN